VYRARGDRFLGHGFHSTSLRNQSGESSDAIRIGPQRKANLEEYLEVYYKKLVSFYSQARAAKNGMLIHLR
jgi:hypothetical protein